MTTSVDTSYGSWPATTPPFVTKYGVVTNLSTGLSSGQVTDPAGAPASLFVNSEVGVWYDPSDMTTMFQDSAGTTPVTAVEQPVGLILDKSKGLGLGTELVTNGDFSNGLAGWSENRVGSLSTVSGELKITSTASGAVVGSTPITTVVGKSYQLTSMARTTPASSDARLSAMASAFGSTIASVSTTNLTSTQLSLVFVATGTTTWVGGRLSGALAAGEIAYFDNISVKELPGYHASQSTSASRPVLSARVNLLTYSEDFSNAVWSKQFVSVAGNTATAPDGTLTADTVTFTASDSSQLYIANNAVGQLTISIYAKVAAGTKDFRIGIYSATDGVKFSANLTATTTWTKFSYSFTALAVNSAYIANSSTGVAGDMYIWGAQLETGSTATRYQSITTATSYDTVGFPHYLKFDGVDDALATSSIDFTATDKMTVVAGVRKLSDAASIITELSVTANSNNGTFYTLCPSDASGSVAFAVRGSIATNAAGMVGSSGVGPRTVVTSTVLNLAGLTNSAAAGFRVNGSTPSQSALGTLNNGGNFGNYPLYIGSRAGTSLPFNGHLYSLLVRGAASTAEQIGSAEAFVNLKTAAY